MFSLARERRVETMTCPRVSKRREKHWGSGQLRVRFLGNMQTRRQSAWATSVKECDGFNMLFSVCCSSCAWEGVSDGVSHEDSNVPVHVEMCTTLYSEGDSLVQVGPPRPPSDTASTTSGEEKEVELPRKVDQSITEEGAQVDACRFTFKNNNILRGVRSDVVLRRGASLLSNAAGSVATFQLS